MPKIIIYLQIVAQSAMQYSWSQRVEKYLPSHHIYANHNNGAKRSLIEFFAQESFDIRRVKNFWINKY